MFPTLLALALGAAAPSDTTRLAPDPAISVRVDSTRREVVLRAGPFTIPAGQGAMDHAHHGAHDAPGAQTPFLPFQWPMAGWLYGFSVALVDQSGRALPRSLIHHVNMMNLERRALLYDAVERTMAAGSETGDVELPRTVGFPMSAGTAMGLVAAWANDTGKEIPGVELVVTYRWSPTNLNPRPLDVLPLYVDVNYRGAGQTDSYDLPPGRSEKQFEFTLPIDGRLLGAGGHLHDHAVDLLLQEVESGRELVHLKARLGPGGVIQEVERNLFGVRGDGLRMHAGRRYRLTAVYDNPTGTTIVNGAMGILIGLFAPSDLREWPRVDQSNPGIRADLQAITSGGAGARQEFETP
ncbi:MAG: hypothetical protein KJZ47_06595 [Gemmatimonadales bacterium]|nr:hypothetical protein [Gemmatimonadales bacterium]